MDLAASRQEIVDSLTAAQVKGHKLRIAKSLADINTPCAFLALADIDHYNVGGEATWYLYLVASNTDEVRNVDELQQLLTAVLPHISPADKTAYVGLPVPEQSAPLPALRITLTATV